VKKTLLNKYLLFPFETVEKGDFEAD